MRLREMIALGGLLLLGGCAGASYAMNEYAGIPVQQFAIDGEDVYRIFDKPAANKLMITPSIAKASAEGFGSGLTFGALDTSTPKPIYEKAALAYLQSTGRDCRILDGYLVLKPQWEFKYDCGVRLGPQR